MEELPNNITEIQLVWRPESDAGLRFRLFRRPDLPPGDTLKHYLVAAVSGAKTLEAGIAAGEFEYANLIAGLDELAQETGPDVPPSSRRAILGALSIALTLSNARQLPQEECCVTVQFGDNTEYRILRGDLATLH